MSPGTPPQQTHPPSPLTQFLCPRLSPTALWAQRGLRWAGGPPSLPPARALKTPDPPRTPQRPGPRADGRAELEPRPSVSRDAAFHVRSLISW